MNYKTLTLAELLQSRNNVIKRNAVSIYRELTKNSCVHTTMIGDDFKLECLDCGKIIKPQEDGN